MKNKKAKMQPEYVFSEAKRGPIVSQLPGKTRITIRIDTDILDWFRSPGRASGYPTSPPADPYVNNSLIRFLGN